MVNQHGCALYKRRRCVGEYSIDDFYGKGGPFPIYEDEFAITIFDIIKD